MSKVYPDTPTLNESMKGTCEAEFMQEMTQEIKGLVKYGTWTIVYRNSVPSAHILPITWYFKFKRFPDGRVRKSKARLCARGDRQVEEVD